MFDALDTSVVCGAALHTVGAAGPSGIDARGWRRLCTSFVLLQMNFVVQLLCLPDSYVLHSFLQIFSLHFWDAGSLHWTSLQEFGLLEFVRWCDALWQRLPALYVIRDGIQAAAGSHQLCVGQIAGMEDAVHAVRSVFNHNDSDAILLVDATNAFNSLNRSVALHNIQQLCPPLARIFIYTYRCPASSFVSGDTILSEEGTSQGDPLAMPMYAIAMIPLIRCLNNDVTQVWYADDACACGRLSSLCQCWDKLCKLGPGFGYFPNASKTWLIVKDRCHSEAEVIFADTNVKITNEGLPYLDSAIGSSLYVRQFVKEKVKGWSSDVTLLAKVAQSQPHAAYSAFTKGLASRWVYVSRTVLDIYTFMQPLEDVIRCVLIPALTGHAPPNDFVCDLFALPPRWGGIGLCNPIYRASQEFSASLKITEPLCSLILHHDLLYSGVKAVQLSQSDHLSRSTIPSALLIFVSIWVPHSDWPWISLLRRELLHG